MSTNFFTAAFANLKTSIQVYDGVISVGIHTEDEREVFYLSFSPVQANTLADFLKSVTGRIKIDSITSPKLFGDMSIEVEKEEKEETGAVLHLEEPPAA